MNLYSITAGPVGTVNPSQLVTIRASIGNAEAADGTQQAAYATPGSITASIGGTFTASAEGTTLTVSAVLTGAGLNVGDTVSGTDGTNAIPPETTILEQISGTPGQDGTYELSQGPISGILNGCTVTSASTVLNATSVSLGALQPGQTLSDLTAALIPGTLITGQLQGITGGPGFYSLSWQQTVPSETMTTATTILAQVQPLSGGDLRHMDALNLQGSHRAIYIGGPLAGGVRIGVKGGDLVILPDQSVYLVTQPLEPWYGTAGWSKAAMTLQNGS
jgi:hypothetical protein